MLHIRAMKDTEIEATARVHVASWQSTYAEIVPASFLQTLSVEKSVARFERILTNPDYQAFIYIGEVDGQIAGYAMGGLERQSDPEFSGELYAIYLLKGYQGCGLGRALVESVATRLRQENIPNMLVWVFAENSARHFYESLGGVHVRDGSFEIDGCVLPEVAYGWRDLNVLLHSHKALGERSDD
jgi:GNAT superfamily N-acetyltransferase